MKIQRRNYVDNDECCFPDENIKIVLKISFQTYLFFHEFSQAAQILNMYLSFLLLHNVIENGQKKGTGYNQSSEIICSFTPAYSTVN